MDDEGSLMPTPPLLPNGKPFRERGLLYGPPKQGKSHLTLSIARAHQDLGSDAKFYGISTDLSYEAIMMGPKFCDLTNVDWTNCESLHEMVDAARKYREAVQPQDFVFVDLNDDAWAFAQDEYASTLTEARTGKKLVDMGDLWKTRGPASNKYPIEGWDWGMPNARYRIFANNLILRMPCHVIVVAREQDMLGESKSGSSDEDPKVKAMFKHVGMKPRGQKEDPFRFHSVLRVQSGKHSDETGIPTTNLITTAGERVGGRRWLGRKMRNGMTVGEEVEDFFFDYLVKVGGWQV
jgi:hypothetical protein